jgi:hypothetical protein
MNWGRLAERTADMEEHVTLEGVELRNWKRTDRCSGGNGAVLGDEQEPTEAESAHKDGRSTRTCASPVVLMRGRFAWGSVMAL